MTNSESALPEPCGVSKTIHCASDRRIDDDRGLFYIRKQRSKRKYVFQVAIFQTLYVISNNLFGCIKDVKVKACKA